MLYVDLAGVAISVTSTKLYLLDDGYDFLNIGFAIIRDVSK